MSMHILFQGDSMKIIQKVGKRRAVVIPQDLCKEVGLQEGDFIELQVMDGMVVIKPKRLVDPHEIPPAHEATFNQA